MVLLSSTLLGLTLGISGRHISPESPLEQSREMVLKWGACLSQARAAGKPTHWLDTSWAFDQKFEELNGGFEGALAMQTTLLQDQDLATKRATAATLGALRQGFTGVPDWHDLQSKELDLAGKYALDSDPETSRNATACFVESLGGEIWYRWDATEPMWRHALPSAVGSQARALAELYAFTPVSVTGEVPALLRLYRSGDAITRSLAYAALGRAQFKEPVEASKAMLAGATSGSMKEREAGYRDLETLSVLLWGRDSAFRSIQPVAEASQERQSSFFRCWTISGSSDENPYLGCRRDLLKTLDSGLGSSSTTVRRSSARALLVVGEQVDYALGSPTRVHFGTNGNLVKDDAGEIEVSRVLLRAAEVMGKDDPALSKSCRDMVTAFHRARMIS